MLRKFVNKKGEIRYLTWEEYVSSNIMKLNAKGFKEVFTNE